MVMTLFRVLRTLLISTHASSSRVFGSSVWDVCRVEGEGGLFLGGLGFRV